MLSWSKQPDGTVLLELVPLDAQAQRAIQGPERGTHVKAGPKLRPMINLPKKCWGWGGGGHLLCEQQAGLSAPVVAAHRCNHGKRKVCMDCMDLSMVDYTHSRESWAYVHHWYRKVCGDGDFWRSMREWGIPHGNCGDWNYRAKARCMRAGAMTRCWQTLS